LLKMVRAVLLLFVAVFVACFAQDSKPVDLSSCGLCTLFVEALEKYASTKATKSDLLASLRTVGDQVCGNIPSEILDRQKCLSYIQLYGPYTLDMVLSKTAPFSVCSSLGLCADPQYNGVNYELLYPVISKDKVEYSVFQKDVHFQGQKFYYRLFLGDPALMEPSLTVRLWSSEVVDYQLEVVNKERKFDELVQCPAGTKMSCTSYLSQPGKGVWYYLTVSVGEYANQTVVNTQFNLTATFQEDVIMDGPGFPTPPRIKTRFVPIFLPIILVALCLSCCLPFVDDDARDNKRSNQSKCNKWSWT